MAQQLCDDADHFEQSAWQLMCHLQEFAQRALGDRVHHRDHGIDLAWPAVDGKIKCVQVEAARHRMVTEPDVAAYINRLTLALLAPGPQCLAASPAVTGRGHQAPVTSDAPGGARRVRGPRRAGRRHRGRRRARRP